MHKLNKGYENIDKTPKAYTYYDILFWALKEKNVALSFTHSSHVGSTLMASVVHINAFIMSVLC